MKIRKIRKDEEAVSPVIAVILMVAITVVLAGVLYVWVSGFGGGGGGSTVKITATTKDKTTAHVITISSVSGGNLNLADAKFEMADTDNVLVYSTQTSKADPASFLKEKSRVYALPSSTGTTVYDDGKAGDPDVDEDTPLGNYTKCFFTYIDQNDDGKLTADDSIWLYKDYDADGTVDVTSRYTFKVLDADGEMVLKKQL